MDFHVTTQPELANPFADTADDPRELQRLIRAAMQKATRRRAAGPAPKMYWEEPGLHGTGRQVNLHGPRAVTGAVPSIRERVRKVLPYRLPPLPKRKHMSGGTMAFIAVGVIGMGLLAGYLAGRRRRAQGSAQIGDMSGLELLGCDA